MVMTQFTTKFKADILLGDVNAKTVASQPMIEKVDWWGPEP
jgi:hypothetical protein